MLTKGVSRTGVRRNIGRNGNKGKKTESQLPKINEGGKIIIAQPCCLGSKQKCRATMYLNSFLMIIDFPVFVVGIAVRERNKYSSYSSCVQYSSTGIY